MIIFVDTREQKPFWKPCTLPSNVVIRRRTLNVGDYTTASLYGKFHIERKSLCDLYGTLIQSHPRFRREIIRARESRIELVVVVEGTHKDFINKNFPRGDQRKCTTTVLRKIVATVQERYSLEIIFCRDRVRARELTLKRLKQEERKRNK